MKYLRLISDIHCDSQIYISRKRVKHSDELDLLWYPDKMEGDDDTCMIIAGDMWAKRRFISRKHSITGKSWIEELASKFKYVLFVLGNHDYWDANLLFEPDKVRAAIDEAGLKNVYLLERDTIVLDQVKFVGGTLWTNYNREDPLTMLAAAGVMNDYKSIRYGPDYGALKPKHCLNVFNSTKKLIFENGKRDHQDQRVIAVTHMAPSPESISQQLYNQYPDNYYYFSDLQADLYDRDHDIEYWFHGHLHSSSDYLINKTRVINNPKGHLGENENFNPKLRITL